MNIRNLTPIIFASFIALILSGCGEEKKKRSFTFFGNMHDQMSVRAQESEPLPNEGKDGNYVRSMRKPVEGTIPTDFVPYTLRGKFQDALLAKNDVNPLPPTMDVLEAGRRAYNIYCNVCHGERGSGQGSVIPSATHPGYYNSGYKSKSKNPVGLFAAPIHSTVKTDGELFNYISRGGVIMPSYGRLPTAMRWSIVHYVRVLQKANKPSAEELKQYKAVKDKYKDIEPTILINHWKEPVPEKTHSAGHDAHSKSH